MREGGWANKGQEEDGKVDESSLQESPTSMAPSGCESGRLKAEKNSIFAITALL